MPQRTPPYRRPRNLPTATPQNWLTNISPARPEVSQPATFSCGRERGEFVLILRETYLLKDPIETWGGPSDLHYNCHFYKATPIETVSRSSTQRVAASPLEITLTD
ncbi:MAG: hypothetical protein ACP5O0_01545 [Acidimicrobiales bacterium]